MMRGPLRRPGQNSLPKRILLIGPSSETSIDHISMRLTTRDAATSSNRNQQNALGEPEKVRPRLYVPRIQSIMEQTTPHPREKSRLPLRDNLDEGNVGKANRHQLPIVQDRSRNSRHASRGHG